MRMPGEKGSGLEWMSTGFGVKGPWEPPVRVNIFDTIAMIGTADGKDIEFSGPRAEGEGTCCASES